MSFRAIACFKATAWLLVARSLSVVTSDSAFAVLRRSVMLLPTASSDWMLKRTSADLLSLVAS
jgi:hypothetical protein